jgi:hypothetical protein
MSYIYGAAANASKWQMGFNLAFKGLNAELNLFCHILALLGAHPILHVSRIGVNPVPHARKTQLLCSLGILKNNNVPLEFVITREEKFLLQALASSASLSSDQYTVIIYSCHRRYTTLAIRSVFKVTQKKSKSKRTHRAGQRMVMVNLTL